MNLDPYIAEASSSYGVPENIIRAVMQKESSGQHFDTEGNVKTSPAGALGAMQLMPNTALGLGVDPYDPRGNVLGGTKYLRQQLDTFGGDLPKALAAYNAGPQAVIDNGGIPPYTETQNYVSDILNNIGDGSYFFSGVPTQDVNAFGARPPLVPAVEPEMSPLWKRAKEGFLGGPGAGGFFNSPLGNASELIWSGINTSHRDSDGKVYPMDWQPSQQDVDYVVKSLPGNYAAQRFILMNAVSPEQMNYLTSLKRADTERAERVANYGLGIATVTGMIGEFVGDPLLFLPLGQEAVAAKALSRLGSVASLLDASRFARYAYKAVKYTELGAGGAGVMTADRYLTERLGGGEQDYSHAALIGGVAGIGLGMLGDLFKAGLMDRNLGRVHNALDNAAEHAVAQASDLPGPNAIPKNTKDLFAAVHDPNFHPLFNSDNLNSLVGSGKVFSVSKADAKAIAAQMGEHVPENASAFHVPSENYTALIKDNIPAGADIDSLLAHEVGVHAGLQKTLGKDVYNAVMEAVDSRLKDPQGPWLDAVKATAGGGREEVLGQWIEKATTKDPLYKKLQAGVAKGLRKMGVNTELTDSELKDYIRRSLQNEVDNARGWKVNPDGSAVVGGYKYSAANIFNPNNMAEVFQLENEVTKMTQGSLPFWLNNRAGRAITKSLEAGRFFGTIQGVLANSQSPTLRKIGSTIFHDARMRNYEGGLVLPAEFMKKDIQAQLNAEFSKYLDARNEAIFGKSTPENLKNLPKTFMVDAKFQAYNEEVVRAYNAVYGRNRAGVPDMNFSPEIMKGVQSLKAFREKALEIGKTSRSRFGMKGENLIGPDWEPRDLEFHRVMDEDKWAIDARKFPSEQARMDFYKDVAKRSVKQDIMEERLLNDHVKAWEKDNAKWQVEKTGYDRDLKTWEEKVAKNKTKDEARYQKILDKWNEKVDAWKEDVKAIAKGETKPAKPAKPARPGATPTPEKPKLRDRPVKPTGISIEELQKYIDDEAGKWMKGLTDRDNLNLDKVKAGNGPLDFYGERFPMDTSMEFVTPGGERWSYDNNLRSYNLDYILPKMANRISGEAAFRNAFEIPWEKNENAYGALRARAVGELETAVDHGRLSGNRLTWEVNALDDGIARLRGVKNQGDNPASLWDAFGRTALNLSYAQNGANMGFNVIGENAGAFAYIGAKSAMHIMPGLTDFIRTLRDGKVSASALKDVEYKVFGDMLENRVWSTGYHSRMFAEASVLGSGWRRFDSINKAVNYAAKMTSTVNFLPSLFERMVRGARSDTLMDTVRWAGGEEFGALRNPFSDKKLAAVGVSKDMAQAIKEDINKYTVKDASGKPTEFHWNQWQTDNPETYYKMKFMVENQALRAIRQQTIGNQNRFKDLNVFTRMISQFKDFVLKSVNGTTMRALTNREVEDAINVVYATGINMGLYAGLSYLRSKANFAGDEARGQQYLEDRLNPVQLARAAFVRAGITGSVFSQANDLYEGMTGAQSIRTTVDRTSRFQKTPGPRDLKGAIGDFVGQLPAFKAIESTGRDAGALYDAFRNEETQADLHRVYNSLPFHGFFPMATMGNLMINQSGLPKKASNTGHFR